MIFIILCSLSCVAAMDYNQSNQIDDNSYTTTINKDYYDYQKNSIIQEKESSNIASTSQKDYSIYTKDNAPEKQEKEYYGVGNFGSNVMSVTIYEIGNNQITPVFTKNEKSVTAEYTENNNLTKEGINKLISIVNDFNGIKVVEKYMDLSILISQLLLYSHEFVCYRSSLNSLAVLALAFDILKTNLKNINKNLKDFLHDWVFYIINEMGFNTDAISIVYNKISKFYEKKIILPQKLKEKKSGNNLGEDNNDMIIINLCKFNQNKFI